MPLRARRSLGCSSPISSFDSENSKANSLPDSSLHDSKAKVTWLPWICAEPVLPQPSRYPPGDPQREADLAHCVLDYLAEHPQATDTLEGIAEWWVMREQVRVDVKLLERVLHRLTEQGFLEEIHGGAQVRFSLKKRSDGMEREESPCQH